MDTNMKLSNTYLIGCQAMFYEIEIIEEYIKSVYKALEFVDNKENVTVEIMWNLSSYFEECESKQKKTDIVVRIGELQKKYGFQSLFYQDDKKPYTMANYRRELNTRGVDYDFTIWGESDCLMPSQTFVVLEQISEHAKANNIHRYITTFAIRKMWDDSWKVLEHNKFTDAPFYEMVDPKATTEQSSIRYTMSQEEMDEINDEVDELDVRLITHPKFDGSGLVISKDLLMTGANLPPAVYMNGDDTAFLQSCLLHLGNNYKQFVVKNNLKVHNRNHTKKRLYVKGEDDSKQSHFKRQTNWYKKFNDLSKGNLDKLFHNQSRFFNYDDFEEQRNG